MSFSPSTWAPAAFQFLGHVDVVFQVILGAVGVEDVAGITDRRLADGLLFSTTASIATRMFSTQLRLSNTRNTSTPVFRRLAHEFLHHVVGVVGVADAIRGAQQHLRHQVGHRLAQVAQALPRAFLQEAVGHVESRAAPTFDAEKLRQVGGIGRRHLDHVDRAHPRRQQRLVPVAHGGVGHQQPLLRRHPVGHGLRALVLEQRAWCPGARLRCACLGGLGRFQIRMRLRPGPAVSGCPFTVMSAI